MPGATVVDEHLSPRVLGLLNASAKKVHRRFRDFIELADLQQEARLWAATNQATIDRLTTGSDPWETRFMATVMKRLDATAEAAKAGASGFTESDEHYWSMLTVELALVQLWNEVGEQHHPEPWASVLADVQRAWKAAELDVVTVRVLGARYAAILSERATGDLLGLSKTTVHRKVREGLLAVAKHLTVTPDLLRAGGCFNLPPLRGAFPEEL